MLLAERHHDGAGERRQIDHEFRLEAVVGVPQRIGQHEAALGVGVQHLDGLAGHRGDDVAGPLRIAVDHVLDATDDAERIDLGLARGEHVHQPGHRGGAAHVALHVLHAGGRLDRHAAGIEDHALADEGDRLVLRLAAVPLHDHQARRASGALRDAEQRAHAELLHFLFGQHLDLDAERFEFPRASGELDRPQNVGRLVDEVARQRQRRRRPPRHRRTPSSPRLRRPVTIVTLTLAGSSPLSASSFLVRYLSKR